VPGTLERVAEIELADRVAEQVDTQRDPGACHAVVHVERMRHRGRAEYACRKRRGGHVVPRDAAIREERHFNRHRTVHFLRHAKRPQQREAELDVANEHAAADEALP